MYVKRGILEGRTIFPVLIFITFLLSALFTGIGAEETRNGKATIYGIISDDLGAPIDGASIVVITLDGSQYNYTHSNETGEYLVNVSFFGTLRVAIMKDSYLEYTNYLVLASGNNFQIDFTLLDRPAETEVVGGTVSFEGGGWAEGSEVSLVYEEDNNRYDYKENADSLGRFDFTVFPAEYNLEVKYEELTIYSEEVEISDGGGPYDYDIVLPSLPPKDAAVMGYVNDGMGPMANAMVGIMDTSNEIVNMTITNETGYYNLGFWEGDHYLISMVEGYDSFFKGIQLSPGEERWINISLSEEKYKLKGWILDPEGMPLEGINVQFLKPFTFPDDNSDETDNAGYFEFDVSGGTGYLMVVEESPFDAGDYDVYFEKIVDLSDNMSFNIDLTQNDYTTGVATMDFDGWTDFTVSSRMALPVNNSKASRAYVDMVMGDGDLAIDQDEFDLWEEAVMGEDSEMTEGPFGDISDENLTVDGMGYQMNESSFRIEFVNFTGPIDSSSPFELQVSANYSLMDDLEDSITRTVRFNGSYSQGREMTVMNAHTPGGWLLTDTSDTLHEVLYEGGVVSMATTEDPNTEDDIDYEWVNLTFHDDTFSVNTTSPDDLVEGESFNLSVNITEYLPKNSFNITYDMGDKTIINTNESKITHSYADNGSYEVEITILDNYTRDIVDSITLDVGNLDPVGDLVIEGGTNRTFEEGQTVTYIINATDVPADPLSIIWNISGEAGDPLAYDDDNRSMDVMIPDDGNFTISAVIDDGDGGILDLNISLQAINVDPEFVTGTTISDGKEDAVQGDQVTITIMSMSDASPEDILTINWTIPGEGYDYSLSDDNMTLEMMFFEVGNYTITLVISDDDGGENTMIKTILIGENQSYDHDGDGIPGWWEDKYGMSDNEADDAELDNDGDNLTNLEEFNQDTDPTDDDTDDDGVPDYYDEDPKDVNVLGYDTDEDGHSDWEEIQDDRDPLDPDDYPGLEDEDSGNLIIWIILLAIALVVILIIVVYMVASNKERGLYSEE